MIYQVITNLTANS